MIVAEISCNHLGSLTRAVELIEAAKWAGADAVKFQSYHPDLMVLYRGYKIESGPWQGETLARLYLKACTPHHWLPHLFEAAKYREIECFASVFDLRSLEALEEINCPRYKVASFEIVDLHLLEHIGYTRKPVIVSTGMADMIEIRAAVNTLRAAGCRDLTLLHCVSAYPAKPEDARFGVMDVLRQSFDVKIGFSDHTPTNGLAAFAYGHGADVIEKHLTLKRSDGGPDAGFSLEPQEFKQLVEACRAAKTGGSFTTSRQEANAIKENRVGFGPTKDEEPQYLLRRSLYFTQDLPAGTVLRETDIASARPHLGLPCYFRNHLIGKRIVRRVKRGEPINLMHTENLPSIKNG